MSRRKQLRRRTERLADLASHYHMEVLRYRDEARQAHDDLIRMAEERDCLWQQRDDARRWAAAWKRAASYHYGREASMLAAWKRQTSERDALLRDFCDYNPEPNSYLWYLREQVWAAIGRPEPDAPVPMNVAHEAATFRRLLTGWLARDPDGPLADETREALVEGGQ